MDELAAVSTAVAEHEGPLRKLAARAEHQMADAEESLYAELAVTGSSAWGRLHADVTSQLSAPVAMPDGTTPVLPMAAIRGLATDADPRVRRAAYDAEMAAWPTVAVACAAALNGVKGEATIVNRPTGLGPPARCVAVRQQRQPGHVRRDGRGDHRLARRLPRLDAHEGGAARPRPAGCRGTT